MTTYPHRQSVYEIYDGAEYVSMLPPMTSEEDFLQEDLMSGPGRSSMSPLRRPHHRDQSYNYDSRGKKQNPILWVVSLLVQNVRRQFNKLGRSLKGTRTS